jgi:hypothetical protein
MFKQSDAGGGILIGLALAKFANAEKSRRSE